MPPVDAQHAIAAWLEAKLWPETSAMTTAIDEAERTLADKVGVAVADVRQNLRSSITG